MTRPAKWRCLECPPGAKVFGPAGARVRDLEKVRLAFDELEALRLLHLVGTTQAEAGKRLGVSGSTVSRMAGRAHRVITEALILGKAVCVEGGPVTVVRVGEGMGAAPSLDPTRIDGASHEGESMVVAVPYLAGQVNARFGSTQVFLVAEVADGRIQRTSLFEAQGMQHSYSGLAGFLKDRGVGVILAGGMGTPMQQALKMQGFNLYCGVTGSAVEAVEAFLRGEIEKLEGTCGHHHGAW